MTLGLIAIIGDGIKNICARERTTKGIIVGRDDNQKTSDNLSVCPFRGVTQRLTGLRTQMTRLVRHSKPEPSVNSNNTTRHPVQHSRTSPTQHSTAGHIPLDQWIKAISNSSTFEAHRSRGSLFWWCLQRAAAAQTRHPCPCLRVCVDICGGDTRCPPDGTRWKSQPNTLQRHGSQAS